MDKDRLRDLIARMSLEEKASLLSGADFWHSKAVARLGIPSFAVSDGPHGLRKQAGSLDHLGLNASVPATCFPTASAMASSWDRELLASIGQALGQEAQAADVQVILGPGANIKRSPLCGRNFEYFSEDPYLAGELAAAMIAGIQSQGVGASLKHFAVNNQESFRISVDVQVDERTLRELYLPAFERAVKKAEPWTVMSSYNRLNGDYASEKASLLTGILRKEWGFTGAVLSDWGGANVRVRGLEAGLDLEMPFPGGHTDREVVEAVRAGTCPAQALDEAVERLLDLAFKGVENRRPAASFSAEAHHALARRAARESMVLLRNEGSLLPLARSTRIAVIGDFAREPRYQGTGSSLINPSRLDTVLDELGAFAQGFAFAPGYDQGDGRPRPDLIAQAVAAAREAEVALVFAGLTRDYEAEGLDRTGLGLPDSHVALIEAVAGANPRTVVVLSSGSAVEMPWASRVPAILEAWLPGQAGAGAVLDLVFGLASPSGKLAESFPVRLSDLPSSRHFPEGPVTVEYREGLYVGYRWFDSSGTPPLFPFGHGLSYTGFEYSGLILSKDRLDDTESLTVSARIRNTGARAGAEVAQLYVRDLESTAYRPDKELKGFQKVFLQPGEEAQVSFILDPRAFSTWDSDCHAWRVESGDFEILLASSSAEVRLSARARVEATGFLPPPRDRRQDLPSYYNPGAALAVGDGEFRALLGRDLSPKARPPRQAFDLSSTVRDVQASLVGRLILAFGLREGRKAFDDDPASERVLRRSIEDMPLRNMAALTAGNPPIGVVRLLLWLLNIGRQKA